MVVWFTRVILVAQNILNVSTVLTMWGQMASQAIQALYSLPYILQCLMMRRPMLRMSTLFIQRPALLAYAAPVKRRRMRVSNQLAGCGGHALPVCLAILGRCLTVLVDKPEEEVDKDNIGLTEALLLGGSVHL
jgi:hypothetical protein